MRKCIQKSYSVQFIEYWNIPTAVLYLHKCFYIYKKFPFSKIKTQTQTPWNFQILDTSAHFQKFFSNPDLWRAQAFICVILCLQIYFIFSGSYSGFYMFYIISFLTWRGREIINLISKFISWKKYCLVY